MSSCSLLVLIFAEVLHLHIEDCEEVKHYVK